MASLIANKLLFIHPPRCGGEWFSKALTNAGVQQYRVGNKHGHACSNIEIYNAMQDPKIKTMTCIRHPAEWYKSYWELKTNKITDINRIEKWGIFEDNSIWHPTWDLDNECFAHTFEGFINNCVDKFPSYLSYLYDDYTRKPAVGTIDYIILTRELEEKAPSWHPTWDLDNECFAHTFEGFINNCVDKFPSYLSYLYDDYTRKPAVGTIDYIILTRELEEKAPSILQECGIALDLDKFLATDRYNSFKKDDVKYSVESINKILSSEIRCISKFNFTTDVENLKDLIK